MDTKKIDGAKPRDVIFILSDDHRYDFMGFTGKVPWLETPNMDQLAKDGIYCQNAFVSISLSSPGGASILTSLYAHSHTVVDNSAPDPENLVFFPEYIRDIGCQTAFFGKMNERKPDILESNGMQIPLKRPSGPRFRGDYRNTDLY